MITINNSIELTTLLCLTILTQLVNYMLAPHNTKVFSIYNQILHKNLFHILKLSVFRIKRVNWLKTIFEKDPEFKRFKVKTIILKNLYFKKR